MSIVVTPNQNGKYVNKYERKNKTASFGVSKTKSFDKGDLDTERIASILARQIDKKIFDEKYAPVKEVLKLAGMGVFIAASFVIPNLPKALKPLLTSENEYEVWKRFNIPYLKRNLQRLEKQKLVEITEEEGKQVVKVTENGKRKILKYALDELAIEKPKIWDRKWRLVSYDIPEDSKIIRKVFASFLKDWGFYPLHKSLFLHAYPCESQIEFLREYLGVGECVRIFTVSDIENDGSFRDFFGV